MARWAWRAVTTGSPTEQLDRAFNERLAERLLCSAFADDFAIALNLVGFKIVPLAGPLYPWPMTEAVPPSLCPSWCMNVKEQQRIIADGLAEAMDGNGRGSNRKARTA
jgi:hypothetical protein